jgi:ferrochelatase
MRPYDALLLVSFGGPEGPADVRPFLDNVTAGRGIPPQRLDEVARHYLRFGGVSRINAQNRALLAALRDDFAANGLDMPIYWGNRNWHPLLADTLSHMRDDGVRRAIAFLTSAYASYSSCRQYLDDIERARAEVGQGAPRVDRLRQYFNHPGFVEPMADAVRRALESLSSQAVHLAFVAHSIPAAMNAASGPAGNAYAAQLESLAMLITDAVRGGRASSPSPGSLLSWSVSYCSRSGSPSVPWLEPDIGDRLDEIAASGADAVVVVPIGFVSDHMEVVYDLDTEAAERAAELGLAFARAETVGTEARFVAMVRELVLERMGEAPPRALGRLGPAHDVCPATCCGGTRL